MKNIVKELQGKIPKNAANIGDQIIITGGKYGNIDGIQPVVVSVYQDSVLACHSKNHVYTVKHEDYFVIRNHFGVELLKIKCEKWREEEMELLYDLQEEVANENPGKDSQRYWEAKHAYDKQRVKIETIKAAMQLIEDI